LTLQDLKAGETATITRVYGEGAFRKRLQEMGFVKGKRVLRLRSAPLQDPIEFRIMNSNVTLRISEASLVEVTKEELPPNAITHGINGAKGLKHHKVIDSANKVIRVALVGNPNSGKTSIFNFASGAREKTGNFAGVTVDSRTGHIKTGKYRLEITDLPGTYSITDYSPEELFVRQHITGELPDVVVNVVDASNLERNLFLTTQLIDMNVRVVVALNMYDEMTMRGDRFDFENLGKMIGIPFVPTIGNRGKGIDELIRTVISVYENSNPVIRQVEINYGNEIESSIHKLVRKIEDSGIQVLSLSPRFIAIKLLEHDKSVAYALSGLTNYAEILTTRDSEAERIERLAGEEVSTLITDARYGFVEGALKETYSPARENKRSLSRTIDAFTAGKYLSYPIFLGAMWVMFQATFILGEYPVALIEGFIAWLGNTATAHLPAGMLTDLLVEGIINGVGGVLAFLPHILILFFFISLMEDTGYMARVAFILDKLMHKIGLHGKSFIPMLMGFGCNVPAIMATRTIESRNDRLVTMLITPFMSCSARYPVYVLLISAFFTTNQGTVLFLIYLFGILLAGIFAIIFKKMIFRKQEIPFVMELPPYRMPTLRAIGKHTWFKGSLYLKKMGGVILAASVIIWVLGYFPRDREIIAQYDSKIETVQSGFADRQLTEGQKEEIIGQLESEKRARLQESSLIGRIGKGIEPVIRPLGFDWKIGVSLIAGAAAKEVVVSTMAVLYQSDAENGTLREAISAAGKPDSEKPFTPLTAFTLMVFVLVYFPCVAVLVAVRRESGKWKWAAFLAIYTTTAAWLLSFVVYNAGRFLGF
jgi:ferrous iron transport protein B